MQKFISLIFIFSAVQAQVSQTTIQDNSDVAVDDTIYVIGSKQKAFSSPGSAHFIDDQALEKFDYTDIGRVLDKVPGVYIQEEDGVGLRPNIGLRGAHPHRSKKVTLMEDGILIGPAPYSAPAAYYFPTPTKASNMEVFKGPSAVKYGPNSIGGAVNIVTRPILKKTESELNLSYGKIQKAMLSNSGTKGNTGWRIETHRLQSEGFKELPNGADTGFEKNDILAKYQFDLGKALGGKSQTVALKASYADENSRETYLGTSLVDFDANAYNRYTASSNDEMDWKHYQLQLKHSVKLNSNISLNTTAYHHKFQRDWFKFNKLKSGSDMTDILLNGSSARELAIIKGEVDTATDDERLVLGNNGRKYFSQGVQLQSMITFDHGDFYHNFSLGARFHRDQVKRNHTTKEAEVIGGKLSYVAGSDATTNTTKDTSRAITLFAEDEVNYNDLTISAGARLEMVKTKREESLDSAMNGENEDNIFIPGIGFNYMLTNDFVFVGGVNKGITLVGPGQDDSIEPEESVNYELGFRLKAPIFLEVIGFYSDYKNIKGTCTFSSGCDDSNLDAEYNGGEAEIFGLESAASHTFKAGKFHFPVELSYTRTVARFTQNTTSDNKEWGVGEIKDGDPLPYVPQDQVSAKVGLDFQNYSTSFNTIWKGKMADQSVKDGRRILPSYAVVDWVGSYKYSKKGKAYLKVDNIFDNTYLVSLRPYGARPGKPRMLSVGLTQKF
ncbi:TonB-dependent receptor domain-containing protein [Bacteriovorax sp. DB6_IX]|uniref:TonB-dependent receptor family protein n=1 Tax=Bacteriovorax sp. DB6_IX TaxID=1353530 RepID=UPI00038A1DFB|nr:TonB-dependent receptor [Bacteriovorax sp. DB6_IX]EQC48103.1 TonB-dependent receptor plug domain protein [Bacteriovorax sp. DB6_IX]